MNNLNFYDRRHKMEFLCGRANKAVTGIEEILNRRLTTEEITTAITQGGIFLIRELKKQHPEAMAKNPDFENSDIRLSCDSAESLIPELDEISRLIDFETQIMDGIVMISTDEVDKQVIGNSATF